MKIKAVIITLLLGSSAVAVAGPRYDVYRDDYRSRYQRPIVLAQDVLLVSRKKHSTFIPIDPRSGIDRLRLDVYPGLAYVETVVVEFADGRSYPIPVGQVLGPQNPSLTMNLPRGPVSGVWIHGNSRLRADRFTYGTGRAVPGLVDVVGLSTRY